MSSSLVFENAFGERRLPVSGHIATLDGLRGIAAFTILIFHAAQIFRLSGQLPHAHLAVDFFFVLSGFVVARAYRDKLQTSMSFPDFVAARLRRIYPVAFIGL